ncbi:hypothetical protein BaRGS_00038944, partial [Batillaria attramentaria]
FRFDFPTLHGTNTLKADENTTLTLPFIVINNCSCGQNDTMINVVDSTKTFTPYCQFFHPKTVGKDNCVWDEGNSTYLFVKEIDRFDNGKFEWKSTSQHCVDSRTTDVYEFVILCPPELINATVITGQSTTLIVSYRAHTQRLTGCLLRKTSFAANDAAESMADGSLVTSTCHDNLSAFPFNTMVTSAVLAFAVGAGLSAILCVVYRLCRGSQGQERTDERVVHGLEEENNDDDELVMIDNVVYNGRRALPRPPMELPVELPYDEIAACPEVQIGKYSEGREGLKVPLKSIDNAVLTFQERVKGIIPKSTLPESCQITRRPFCESETWPAHTPTAARAPRQQSSCRIATFSEIIID